MVKHHVLQHHLCCFVGQVSDLHASTSTDFPTLVYLRFTSSLLELFNHLTASLSSRSARAQAVQAVAASQDSPCFLRWNMVKSETRITVMWLVLIVFDYLVLNSSWFVTRCRIVFSRKNRQKQKITRKTKKKKENASHTFVSFASGLFTENQRHSITPNLHQTSSVPNSKAKWHNPAWK